MEDAHKISNSTNNIIPKVNFIIRPQNECFEGYTQISLSVHSLVSLYVYVFVCVQNTGCCQSAGGGIKLHLVTALVF